MTTIFVKQIPGIYEKRQRKIHCPHKSLSKRKKPDLINDDMRSLEVHRHLDEMGECVKKYTCT